MKQTLTLLICLIIGGILSAQDVITKTDGTDIPAKVIEVGQSSITYKKFSNPNGPTYSINISDIIMITYENGEREMYSQNNKTSSNSLLPQGVMTFNSWSGKVSVGGVTLEDEMLDRYFSPEDYKLYKSGKTTELIGCIAACIGAVPFGWSIGWMIGGGKPNLPMLIGGGIAFIGGYTLDLVGGHDRRKAINNYNSSLAFYPEIRLGATSNGIGLVFAF